MAHYEGTPVPNPGKGLKILGSSVPVVKPGTRAWVSLIHRVRETVRRIPPAETAPVPRWLLVLRVAVFSGGVLWTGGGLLEMVKGNPWLGCGGIVLGAISVIRGVDLGRTRSDARIRRSDRPNLLLWALVPLSAIGLLFRIAWLLEQGPKI